jgi:hypothetical protein
MAIRTVRTFPLRSDGLSQDEYSTGVENSLTDLPLAINDFNAAASAFQLAVTGTSTTSVLIGTGSKSFTTQTGLGFVVGMTLRIANSSTVYMTGDVTSYTTGTGALVVNVTAVVGSGTLAYWSISLAAVGANAAGSVSFTPAGNISATNVQTAIQELDTEKLSSAAGAVTGTNLEDITTSETVGGSFNIPVITFDVNGRASSKSSSPKIINGNTITATGLTSHEFSGISPLAKKITFMVSGLSTSGTSNMILQIGDSGGVENTGYASYSSFVGATSGVTTRTDGFAVDAGTPSATWLRYGSITLCLLDSSTNTWTCSFSLGANAGGNFSFVGGGSKSLSATLDRVRLTTIGGTDTIDAGISNVLVE